jgi:hypothetical protein
MGAVFAALACLVAVVALQGSHPVSASAAGSTCVNPPAVFPEEQVQPGLLGTGKTVVSGTTPSSFNVKVLGVLNDGIAPGLDLIVVKLSGAVMTQTGGAFEGISGSPVYVNGKLLGAVSYTLSFDNTIAGLTPAGPMMNLFGYPSGGATTLRSAPAMPKHIALPNALRSTVDHASSTATTSDTMSLLRVPIGVSGLSDTGMQRLQRFFDRHGLAYTAFRGGSAAAPNGVSGPPIVAGSNFTATQSFGDLTFYGLGTATAVCGNEPPVLPHRRNVPGDEQRQHDHHPQGSVLPVQAGEHHRLPGARRPGSPGRHPRDDRRDADRDRHQQHHLECRPGHLAHR